MFARLKLEKRMYVQFFAAILPLVGVLVFETLSTSDLPARVDTSLGIYDEGLQAADNYKTFLNGVSDAVDTGKLGDKALKALANAKTHAAKLAAASKSAQAVDADARIGKIQSAIAEKNALETLTPLKADINAVDTALAGAIASVKTELSAMVTKDGADTRSRSRLLSAVAIATLLLLAFIVRKMVRGLTRPIAEAVETARRVAAGDLTSRIAVTRHDEMGELQEALRDMNAALIAIVADVRQASREIADGAAEIAHGNEDLSQRTERQAASLGETARSISDLTTNVSHNADHSRVANDMVHTAADVATRGGRLVEQVVTTMSSINAGSRRVAEIITVMEGIAFQTNILALNAAVEAARAGEQGRGFAVVATEVRNLAQRAASSAKEIKTMIEASVGEVAQGAQLVEGAGATMKEILDAVSRVAGMMSGIQAESAEQRARIESVNRALVDMDAMTQQNAALVEQAANAAASVRDRTVTLSATVGKFVLAGDAANGQHAMRKANVEVLPARVALPGREATSLRAYA